MRSVSLAYVYAPTYGIIYKGKETEHNWALREQAIQRVRGMLKGDVHNRYSEPFLLALKEGFIQWSLKTVRSLMYVNKTLYLV